MKTRIISLLFCIALVLNVICPFALAEDEYYTSQTEFTSDALFQIIGPDNAVAQYFTPDFTSLQTVKVFTYSDNANTKYTLSIRKAHGDSTDLYTEEFTKADTAAAWFTMTLTTPLTLVKGEMYSFVVSSGDRAVVNGSTTLGDISNGEPACRTYSYDKATRPDSPWVITQQRLAFEVTGTESAPVDDIYYTSQTEFTSDALFQIIGPNNAVAQYFTPDFTSLQTVKVFTYSDNANTKYTLSIRKAHGDSTDLYTEEFTKADTAAAWFTMTLTTPLTLVKGEMYSFVVSSGDRAVVNGSATLGDISNGEPACRTYSYDKATRPDSPWVITQQRLAFEVTGTETSPSDAVISTIAALPETITETDIAAVENAKYLYSALTADQKAQVTNYSKLQSAMEGIEDLYTDNAAKYYNKQTEITSTALFQIMATNNAAGQYFIPGFNRIGAIKVYTSSTEADTEYTLRICTEPADSDTDIYTETFTRKDTAEGWFTMELSNPVNVKKGEKYAYVLTSNKSAVLYGDAESMGDAPCGTCNYDLRAYPDNIDPGWDYPQIRTAFKVIGEHFTAPEVIAVIEALPIEITDNDIKTVQYANDLYTALLESEKSAVTNYSKLEAALASVAALEKTAAMNKAAAKLDTDIAALPATIALSDESKIVALETSYNDFCTLYGDEFKSLIKNYATLTAAREALNKLKAIKYGDIDGNGLVTAADALMALQYSVDKITLTEQQLTAAGVDLNVGISASDALLILQFSVNKITVFPIEQKAE